MEEEARGQIRVYDRGGVFIGLYGWEEEQGLYRPVRMFYEKQEKI